MRKRIAQTKKSRNANISLEPDFKKWMTTEAYKRGFPGLSQFARYAMEFLVATDHRRSFAEFNRLIEALPSAQELTTGSGKSQHKLLLAFVWCIVFQLPNFYETIF